MRTIKTILTGLTLSAAMMAQAADNVKVGFVYVGPTGDAGWTYSHDEARKYVIDQIGSDKVETSYVESVAEGADAERVIRNLAAKGHDLIFTTSFGYMNPTLKVAKRFPKVKFEHATGYKQSKNVGTYMARAYQARYLTGLVAGKMTKSDVIGYVGSFPIPEVIRGINAFTKGVREVNPNAKVKVVWVSSWYDPAKEREAAESLILQNADVLAQHTDSAAVIQTAESKGKYAIGYHSDMSAFGANAHLTSAVHNWGPIYLAKTQALLDKKWVKEDLWYGIKEGVTDIAPLNKAVPQDVRDLVEAKKADIKDGKIHVFDGPVKDQSGKVKVAKGASMSDGELKGFNWYVEGVDGQLPKS